MPSNELPVYDDWTIAQKHREIVEELRPPGTRSIILQKNIPGFVNGRFTADFKAGIFMMPLRSRIVTTFSDRHDVERTTMLVVADGVTTVQTAETPKLMQMIERIRNRFASRRIMNIIGELYSTHSNPEYDADDAIARRFDIVPILLTTTIREIR